MNYIGVDLHKKSITICVMNEKLKVVARKTLTCGEPDQIVEFFREFRPFKVVVEATASYLWFVELLEPLAEKVVLANPKKLRVIAESTKKTDRLDAQVLAEFLVRDMIPESYMPTPRQRQHRRLVRHRQYLRGRLTSVRCKIRHILGDYNADRRDLFSAQRRRPVCDQAVVVGARGASGPALGPDQEDQGVRGQSTHARGGSPEDPQDGPGRGFCHCGGVAQRAGGCESIPQRQSRLRLRGPGAGGTAKWRQKVQGSGDHQGGIGAFALGVGGVGLAAREHQPEMDRCLLPTEDTRRQQAGDRRGGQEAVVCALRDAQDIDSLQGDNHLAGGRDPGKDGRPRRNRTKSL
jgi:hypothetical protein